MRHRRMLLFVLAAVAVFMTGLISSESRADMMKLGMVQYKRSFEVVDKTADIVELRYSTAPNPDYNKCKVYRVYLEPSEGLEVLGPTEWNEISVADPLDVVLRLKVARGDTCSLHFCERADCAGTANSGALVYFVSIADSIEVHHGKIRPADPRNSNEKRADLWESLLSQEQLDYMYEIEVSLGYGGRPGSSERQSVEELLGPIAPSDHPGMFLAKATRRDMLQLLRWSIGFRILSHEYPDVQHILDSVRAASPPR